MKKVLGLALALCCASILTGTTVFAAQIVLTADIADGAVTDAKITGPISGAKLGAHGHYGSDLVDGTVTTEKIADGAITDAKITGPISVDKIVGLPEKYANIIVVAKTGGDTDSPITAMNLAGVARADNPYLIKIMPGVYELPPGNTLYLRDYVDIEGSGEGVTILSGSAISSMFTYNGLLTARMVNHAEVRDLTVQNSYYTAIGNGSMFSTGVTLMNSSVKLVNVTAIALPTDGTCLNGCQGIAVRTSSSTMIPPAEGPVVLQDVKAMTPEGGDAVYVSAQNDVVMEHSEALTSSGKGLQMAGAGLTLNDVKVVSQDGPAVNVYGSTRVEIRNSILSGSTLGLAISGNSPAYVLNTVLEAITPVSGSAIKCAGSVDGNYDPVVCQ